MTLAVKQYAAFAEARWKGLCPDLSAVGTHLYVCITTDEHSPDQDGDVSYADIKDYEITGTGYTAGGVEVTSKTVTRSGLDITLDCTDATWNAATFAGRWGHLYYHNPAADADKLLLAFFDFETNLTVTNGVFSLQVDADGLLVESVTP